MITPVLLCGGSGTRLWPLSRKSFPKQFVSLIGETSLFQASVERLSGTDFTPPVVVTGSDFRFIVTEQMDAIGVKPRAILIEPAARNTAPAILAAALWLAKTDPDQPMLVAPSDHVIPDAEAFAAADLPTGVVNVVQGGRETGAALLDAGIDALMFTGSGAAGAHFRRKFADDPHVILALELGGNNPLVVWDAADAEAFAGIAVQSAFITTGQRCSCARRLIVPEGPQGDAVIEAIAALSDRLIFGPWDSDPEPYAGPLISARAADAAPGRSESRRS